MKKHSSIELLEARIAPATFTVTDFGNAGPNTLRQAILDANSTPGADTIVIPRGPADEAEIVVTSALPAITQTVEIAGGSIAITGTMVAGDGLVFSGAMHAGSSISGIGVNGFAGNGIVFANAGGNMAYDVFADGVGGSGFKITSPNNTIDACISVENGTDGIRLETQAANGNTITGSYFGTVNFSGLQPLPNAGDGIHLIDAVNNLIENNFIGGNGANGVHISGNSATGNIVRANQIGLNKLGNAARMGASGVLLDGGVLTTIGGLDPGDGNSIINCALDGVRVTGNANSRIVGNTFGSTVAGLPIDLGGDGLTPNDLGTPPDSDTGPNFLQNSPELTAVTLSGNSYVTGVLHSTPSTTFRIDFFSKFGGSGTNGSLNGTISVTTDASGLATFTQNYPMGSFPDGTVIYATASTTTVGGVTSESAPATFATGTEFVKLSGLRTATFIDADGDPVKITATNGVFDLDNFALVPAGKGAHLEKLTLDAGFNRASVSIVAGKARGGNGLVNVGSITGDEINLDALTVDGDLNHLSLGRTGITQSLGKLTVHSLGVAGGFDFPEVFSLGGIGAISVLGDVKDFRMEIHGGLAGGLTVKGNLNNLDFSAFRLGSLTVAHDMMNSDIVTERGAIGNVTIGGSILDTTNGSGIHAATTLGTVVVRHDISSTGMGRISISAAGLLNPPSTDTSLAIGNLKTGGSVTNFDLLAGYDADLAPVNRNVHIGALTIGGNWMGSNAVAGALRGMDGYFGTGDDTGIANGTMGYISRIASVVIKGTVTGGGMAKFGFVADQIGGFKFGRTVLALSNNTQDDFAVGSATDVHVHEL